MLCPLGHPQLPAVLERLGDLHAAQARLAGQYAEGRQGRGRERQRTGCCLEHLIESTKGYTGRGGSPYECTCEVLFVKVCFE
jgi:hypothetical protein